MASSDLHATLRAEINRRLALAKAAEAAKPGDWSAVSIHDGVTWDGFSRVLATEMNPTPTTLKRVSPVASMICDSWPAPTSFADGDPTPALTAEHIALHDPADAIRRYEGEFDLLQRHYPIQERDNLGPVVICAYEWGDSDGYMVRYDRCPEVKGLAHRLGVSVDG